jgi:class 3 adenylate cyclase/predicted ATPase
MTAEGTEQQIRTFVFTDLVDSTRLTRALPAQVWRGVKHRHDELVLQCARDEDGLVVKGTGDGFFIAFPTEEPAIRFAIAVQRAVRCEPWHEGTPVEVKIGMDSGPAFALRDRVDFEGDAVNVAARVCDRARAGEVLLSSRAYAGARSRMEPAAGEVKLEPVGEVPLKGLPTLEPLYRVWAPGMREGIPPLKRVGNLAAHLQPAPFIGRDELLAEIAAELRRHAVVTLLGPGGIGKTRLAVEVGARVEAEFKAGVWVVSLEAIRQPEAVATEILATLGIKADHMDPKEAILRHVSDWQGLLILDNLEQLVDEPGVQGEGVEDGAFVELIDEIARRSTPARVICTSRRRLNLGDAVEAWFELPALPAPEAQANVAELRQCPSAQLCVEQLRQRVRQFALNEASAPHVAAICRATEGVPLLIELAAGQLGRRTLPQIARDVQMALADPSRDRDRPDRHRDLARLLDWSLALLGEERPFFIRLGVFRGSFDAGATAEVTEEPRAEEFLQRLVEAHLVICTTAEDYLAEVPRYRLLAATAAYCRAQLGGELPRWRQRHAAYYGALARATTARLVGTPANHFHGDPAALGELAGERDNMSAALETALELGDIELAAAIGEPVWELLLRMGLWPLVREMAARLHTAASQAALRAASSMAGADETPALSREAADRALAVASMALAQSAHVEGRAPAARDYYEAAMALWRRLGDRSGEARALHGLGNALRRLKDLQGAESAYNESLKLTNELGDEPARALNLTALGLVASELGRLEEAEQKHSEAVTLVRGSENPWGLAITLNGQAQNLERMGQLRRAHDLYAESLAIKRELGDRRGIAITLGALARIAPTLGQPEAAGPLLSESLAVNRELGDSWGCVVTLGALAERWLAHGDAEPALEAAASARQALEALGGGASMVARKLEDILQASRSHFSPDQADALEQRGRQTPLMRACDAALGREGES